MVYKKLPDEDRRRMVLEAVTPWASVMRVAQKYGIQRNALYGHIKRAMQDPEGKMREAEAEAAFRRKVYEMTR
jgi:transposase-like protein